MLSIPLVISPNCGSYIAMIMEKKYDLAAEFFQLASVDFVADHGEAIRSLAKFTDSAQLNSLPFMSTNSFV